MNNYYQDMLEKGQKYQDFIMIELHKRGIVLQPIQSRSYQLGMENLLGMEIKFDDKMKDTGNIYFETHEKSNADNQHFIESGILRNDNSWLFAIGDYSVLYIFSKKRLCSLYERLDRGIVFLSAEIKKISTSRGFIIPVSKIMEICDKRIFFTQPKDRKNGNN